MERLLHHFGSGSAAWTWLASATSLEIEAELGLSQGDAELICTSRVASLGREQMARAQAAGATALIPEDDDYPRLLLEAKLPPQLIWVRGGTPAVQQPAVAVVGTRNAAAPAMMAARKLSAALAVAGVQIVSGLAQGIDTAAHAGALDAGGNTWAVLAHGIDRVYPAANSSLVQRLVENGGGVLSEFPCGEPPHKYNFRWRNRLIAALGWATLVIEAPPGSGALITAGYASEMQRTVLATPGDVARLSSRGSNALIRDGGATVVLEAVDVLVALGMTRQGMERDVATAPPAAAPSRLEANLGLMARRLLAALIDSPGTVADLAQRAELSLATTSSALVELELANLVSRDSVGCYRRR